MTVSQIDAGPETDLAVAEALFHDGEYTASIRHGHCWIRSERDGPKPFRPSTDWADAMLAAERFGLFDEWGYCLIRHERQWFVADVGSFGKIDYDEGYRHESGPLAICRALLWCAQVSK